MQNGHLLRPCKIVQWCKCKQQSLTPLRTSGNRTMSEIGGLILFGLIVSFVGSAATAILYCVCVRMTLPPLSRQEEEVN